MFLLGTPGVPADGMGALPRQLAAGLAGRIEVERPVERLERTAGGFRVTTAAGSLAARAVVVATDPSSAVALAGVPAPRMKGLVTWWYTTDEAPLAEPVLVVDGRRRGPVVNAAVLSAVAPSYAPAGRHLVEVTCLLGEEGPPSERDARRQAGEMFGCPTAGWAVVARHVIPQALPVQPAPLVLRRDVDLGGGLFVCGDHRDTASIQGALVSGRRAGRAVVQRLRSGRA
jgi:hypothetical protein